MEQAGEPIVHLEVGEPDQVMITSGISPAFLVALSALIACGDEVILSDPHYACYPSFIRFMEGVPRTVPLERAKVGITPGVDFGSRGEGYVRFSYANSLENIAEGLHRIEAYLNTLDRRRASG
jgi:aspartate/methionine/tyrosine aminotransferase